MSRLEELIQQYCPNGVEYIKIKELAEVGTGSSNGNEAEENGKYPFYIRSQTLKYKNDFEYDEEAIIIPGEGGVGDIFHYINGKYAIHQRVYRIHFVDNRINTKFAFHYMKGFFKKFILKKAVSATVTSIRKPMIEEFEIAVPPLEVQREIVEILDKFSFLSAELSAELKTRKKQYEYYKDQLLSFIKDGIQWKPLGEISNISRGASPRPIKSFITDDDNGVNWIKIGDVSPDAKYVTKCAEKITEGGAQKSRRVYPGDFILSNSMSFGRPYIMAIEGCIHDGWLSISNFEECVTPDYLYHVLTSSFMQREMRQKASFGGAVQNLNADTVRGIQIPVPTIEKQKEITNILDKYSVFCTDIRSGLPAEIEARQKQYEYYRDKLLTFKRLES